MDPLETLIAVQDALKAALKAELGTVAVDLGYPTNLEPQHVWIEGTADGETEYDLSNGVQSGQAISLTVDGITQYAGTYEECRTRLKTLWDAVTAAAATLTPGDVDQVEFDKWVVKEGRTAEGTRQMGFSRDVDCTQWLG